MNMNVSYRDFEEKDFGAFREMVFCLYEEDPEGQPIDDEKLRKTIGESLAHPEKIRIIMIRADDVVAGYGILVFYWSNEYGGDILNIDELYIKKEYRGNRVASDFIKNQIDTNKNIVAVAVETTSSNSAAAKLYMQLGFKASPNYHLVLI